MVISMNLLCICCWSKHVMHLFIRTVSKQQSRYNEFWRQRHAASKNAFVGNMVIGIVYIRFNIPEANCFRAQIKCFYIPQYY